MSVGNRKKRPNWEAPSQPEMTKRQWAPVTSPGRPFGPAGAHRGVARFLGLRRGEAAGAGLASGRSDNVERIVRMESQFDSLEAGQPADSIWARQPHNDARGRDELIHRGSLILPRTPAAGGPSMLAALWKSNRNISTRPPTGGTGDKRGVV